MQFDSLLNLVWLLAGLVALICTARSTFRDDTCHRGPKWLLLVGVGLIVAALFPYISATDDVLRIDDFHSHESRGHQGSQPKTDNLIRLYETTETAVACQTAPLVLTFFFVAFVLPFSEARLDRTAPQLAGRSPPEFTFA